MSIDLQRGFRIGDWIVFPLQGEIACGDKAVHLEPKVMEVLVALAERSEDVVRRETLLDQVWGPRAATSDEPLTRCIAQLRQALGDSSREPEFIETVPKRGYRLKIAATALPAGDRAVAAATIEPSAGDREAPAARASLSKVRPWAVAAAVLVAIGIGVYGLSRLYSASSSEPPIAPNSIAVLPFSNLTADPRNEFLGDGLADEILSRLNQIPQLRPIARMSAFSFKGSAADAAEIASRLRVNYLLQGTVSEERNGIRVTADLVNRDGYQIWTDTFSVSLDDLDDVFAVRNTISSSIVSNMNVELGQAQQALISANPATNNGAAWLLVQRARQQIARRDQASLRRAVTLLKDAIAADQHYGEAYLELARTYALLPSYAAYESDEELYDLALAALTKGREMDPSIQGSEKGIEAFISFDRWDWIWAETMYREALAHSPWDADLLQSYSNFLAAVGRMGEAVEAAELARASDPVSPVINDRLAVTYLWVDRDEEAERQFAVARELGLGESANRASFMVLQLRLGRYAEARTLLRGLQRMFVRPTAWIDPFLEALEDRPRVPAAVAAVAMAADNRTISAKYLFGAWLYLNELDRAMDTAFELMHDPQSLDVEFLFSREAAAFRQHERFGALIRRIGLDRYWDEFGWPDMCSRAGDDIACH